MAASDSSGLRLVRGTVNPIIAQDRQLFLLKGDATQEHVHLADSAEMQIPAIWHYDRHPFQLKILHFNDLHGQIARVSHTESVPVFSKLVSYIEQSRATCQENPNAAVIVLAGGDDMIGTPFDLLLSRDLHQYLIHPGYHAYSTAGIDASVLGNHEFDLGLDFLAHAIRRDANFPVLAANLKPTKQLAQVCDPAAIIYLKGVRIGLIGLTTPTADLRSRPGSEFEIVDPIPVVKNLLPIIRQLSDIVIILSHLGLHLNSPSAPVGLAGDVELAQHLPTGSVDLIIGAHTHTILNQKGFEPSNIVNGIPIVQADCKGRHLGQVDLILRETVTVANAVLHPSTQLEESVVFTEQCVQPLLAQLYPRYEKNLGRVTSLDITTAICCEQAAAAESAMHNFMTDTLVAGCRARGLNVDFAMLDASVTSAGLHAGQPLTWGDWLGVMPYEDTLILLTLTGKQLAALIQDNARRIDLADEPPQDRGFQHFSQDIRYHIQRHPLRSEIKATEIKLKGLAIESTMDMMYRLVCITFFRGLARNWEKQVASNLPLLIFDPKQAGGVDTGLFFHDLMLEHIRRHDGITPAAGAVRDGRLEII